MHRITIITFITLLLNGIIIHGQIGWEWANAEKCTRDSLGIDVLQDSLGNIYVTGYFGG